MIVKLGLDPTAIITNNFFLESLSKHSQDTESHVDDGWTEKHL